VLGFNIGTTSSTPGFNADVVNITLTP
jgi:hypothetical protein